MRVPYLYIATASTKQGSDQWTDFEAMRFSRRHEVILADPALRHHDLSDYGRGVSAVLGIRGAPQEMVLRTYAEVQRAIVCFLDGDTSIGNVRPAVEPAPTTAQVIDTLSDATPAALRAARERDPDARLFNEQELQKLVTAARGRAALADQLSRFALEVHPKSVVLHKTVGEVAPAAAAPEIYRRCAALDVPPNDWRSDAAHMVCRERAGR